MTLRIGQTLGRRGRCSRAAAAHSAVEIIAVAARGDPGQCQHPRRVDGAEVAATGSPLMEPSPTPHRVSPSEPVARRRCPEAQHVGTAWPSIGSATLRGPSADDISSTPTSTRGPSPLLGRHRDCSRWRRPGPLAGMPASPRLRHPHVRGPTLRLRRGQRRMPTGDAPPQPLSCTTAYRRRRVPQLRAASLGRRRAKPHAGGSSPAQAHIVSES